jgi:hypothetical protein
MNTFQKWCSDELKAIETQLRETGTPMSTYLADKIQHLKAGIRHGDELRYDLDIAVLEGDEYEINRILLEMRERDLAGAGYTR